MDCNTFGCRGGTVFERSRGLFISDVPARYTAKERGVGNATSSQLHARAGIEGPGSCRGEAMRRDLPLPSGLGETGTPLF